MSDAPSFRIVNARRLNAKTWANNFRARILLPGLVSYEDQGCGLALLSHESIANSIETFVGRPLILTPKLSHKHVKPETMERDASGYITKAYFDVDDGWFYVEGIVFEDKAKDAINKVGLVSCAYKVTKTGNGGERNAIKYQEEILQFSGEHLAIVENPRYEGATIRLNSKQSPTNTNPMKFKFWSKKPASYEGAPAAVEVVKENALATVPAFEASATDISADSELELADGVKVTLGELIAHRENAKSEGIDGEKEFVVNGKAVKMNDLVAAYNKCNEEKEKDEDDKDKKENAEKPEDKKENAAPAAVVPEVAPVAPAAPKKDFFKILTNASVENSVVQDGVKLSAGSMAERLDKGKTTYGSAAPATK
jgi:hypothetical protein